MNLPFIQNYPVEDFPTSLRDLILELHDNTNAPIGLIGPAVLGMASLACQNSIDVRRPNCAPSSCGLYILTIANSGEGKSTVSDILSAPVREFEEEKLKENEPRLAKYEVDKTAWEISYKVIVREIEKSTKTGSSVEEAKLKLEKLLKEKPTLPIVARLIYDNVTPEAVIHDLCRAWQSVAVIADEASNFFNGRASNDLATWSKLWDGNNLTVDRKSFGKLATQTPRCGLQLSIQDAPFRRFLSRTGMEPLENGFIPRFLVSCPLPTRGTRFLNDKEKSWIATEKYSQRVKEILRSNAAEVESGNMDRTVLGFSPLAQARWVRAFNAIELESAPGNVLSGVTGYAAKAADNLARVAAIFHFFEGVAGEISVETVERAIAVCQWHAGEFRRLFDSRNKPPVEYQDAQILERWLLECVANRGMNSVFKNYIRQFGPSQIRNKVRLDNALMVLNSTGRVSILIGANRVKIVFLNFDGSSGAIRSQINHLV